ncbi:tetratricopeptide repeat protein [Chloroflexi bacterium CFX6]|nr:tetratricopeptide repeat protein [Chloroflexi bacterium CFX6]
MSTKRKSQLDAVLIQLSSQRPSDVWRGMEQARQWLKEDPEDKDVYGILLDAVQKNRELREQVRALFFEMIQNGSQSAEKAMLALPSSLQDFLADADDAYYAAEYERAIQLYRQVLKLDPENARARDHIAKAEIKRITGESATGLPRAAEQYYRRARSYLAARDVVTAMNLLKAAIETAQAKGIKYSEAEEALINMQNLIVADEFRKKAKAALKDNKAKEALELYNKALALDSTNELMKKEFESLQKLLQAETTLRKQGILKIFTPISRLQSAVEDARLAMDSDNPLLTYVERQIGQIRLLRITGLVFLLAIVILPLYFNGNFAGLFTPAMTSAPSPTGAPTNTVEVIPTFTEVQTTASTPVTDTPEMETNTPPPAFTETFTSTPTESILGVGYINKQVASAWKEPNAGLLGTLSLNTPLTLLEEREVSGSRWYRCRWEVGGIPQEGWILGGNITFGPPPTPRP